MNKADKSKREKQVSGDQQTDITMICHAISGNKKRWVNTRKECTQPKYSGVCKVSVKVSVIYGVCADWKQVVMTRSLGNYNKLADHLMHDVTGPVVWLRILQNGVDFGSHIFQELP